MSLSMISILVVICSKIECKDTTKNRYMQIYLQNYLRMSEKSSKFAAQIKNQYAYENKKFLSSRDDESLRRSVGNNVEL